MAVPSWHTWCRTAWTCSSTLHRPSPESPAVDDSTELFLPERGNCTCRIADDRFRACRIDGQNISGVTCFDSFFRILLDLKGDGGYIIAPPSKHASGNSYAW